MTSSKGSHNFWSQLLISMIAILALPAAQGLEYPNAAGSENYHNQRQQIQQQTLTAAFVVRRVQTGPILPSGNTGQHTKPVEIEPHFFTRQFSRHAPIRAGPFSAI